MFTILAAIAGCLIGVLVTRIMAKPEKETVTVREFRCPYCTIEITGAKQLDLINHVGCVTKSEEDLKSMQKKAEDEYFTEFRRASYASGSGDKLPTWFNSAFTNYDVGGGYWWVIQWILFCNGKQVDSAYCKSMSVAYTQVEKATEKHKYLRRTGNA